MCDQIFHSFSISFHNHLRIHVQYERYIHVFSFHSAPLYLNALVTVRTQNNADEKKYSNKKTSAFGRAEPKEDGKKLRKKKVHTVRIRMNLRNECSTETERKKKMFEMIIMSDQNVNRLKHVCERECMWRCEQTLYEHKISFGSKRANSLKMVVFHHYMDLSRSFVSFCYYYVSKTQFSISDNKHNNGTKQKW